MDARSRELCEKLAGCIVGRNFDEAHRLLAPWLRSQVKLQAVVDAAAEGLAHPPKSWTIDEGMAELDELRKPDGYGPPSQPISKEITPQNFRGWLSIQLVPEESVHDEQNVCFDLWVAAVEHNGEVLAGYIEAAEAT